MGLVGVAALIWFNTENFVIINGMAAPFHDFGHSYTQIGYALEGEGSFTAMPNPNLSNRIATLHNDGYILGIIAGVIACVAVTSLITYGVLKYKNKQNTNLHDVSEEEVVEGKSASIT